MTNRRSFWKSLFDFSFNNFVAVQIIGILYILSVALFSLFCFSVLIGSLKVGGFYAFSGLIFVPLSWLVYVILTRVALEALVSSIKTAENTTQMLNIMRQKESI